MPWTVTVPLSSLETHPAAYRQAILEAGTVSGDRVEIPGAKWQSIQSRFSSITTTESAPPSLADAITLQTRCNLCASCPQADSKTGRCSRSDRQCPRYSSSRCPIRKW